jgi:putative transposase
VLEVARSNPTDGTRMVTALAGRELGAAVNRKRVQRLMREHALVQRRRSEGRRRRPGYFPVTRPDEPWHLDMERHEALLDRVEVRDLRGPPVAAGG